MTDLEITLLGEPRAVNPAAIERELSLLWKSATENGTPHPVLRACALNLLVYLKGSENLGEISEVIGELTVQHPNRAVVLISEPDRQPAEFTSWVTAQCHLSRAGGKQVCCEQIVMNASGDQVRHLSGAAIPLLLADLPVYLWWTNSSGIEEETFKKLALVADRVIIDSAQFLQPKVQFRLLMSLFEGNGTNPSLGDLNWSRLRPWRELIAQFFDSASCLAKLSQIDRMIIDYRTRHPKVSTLPAQPLLLAGWFTGCLGWKPSPSHHHVLGLTHHLLLEKDASKFEVEVRMVEEETGSQGDVVALRLMSSGKPQREFCLQRETVLKPDESAQVLEASVREGSASPIRRQVALRPGDKGRLLGDQLRVQSHDRVFEKAWKIASELTSW
jgi:glucose-6-phosphate dehydrogenase assembly protein OpcA